VSGSTLRSTVNGGTPLTATDAQYATGQVGLATFNASANFDDVLVDSTTTTPPTSAPPTTTRPPTTAPPTSNPPTSGPPTSGPPTSGPATSSPPTTGPPVPQPTGLIGFASLNAMGQNGVTGGAGGPTVTVTTTQQLLDAIDTVGPLIIRVQGTINITSKQGVRPNKSILGVGTTAVINGGGLDFYRSFNVMVRNITFTNAEDDAINIGQNSHHIWIDHNRFVSPVDGALDYVRGADYVTISWNHFDHTDKTMLISHSDSNAGEDTGHLKVTIHHNWFDNSRQRHPRVRFGEPVHVFNNYFLANELYAIASTENGGVLAEGNYFENVPFPCFSASGYADSGPGRLVQRGNIFVGSGTCETAGTVVEPRTHYPYSMDAAANVPAIVRAGAGVGKIGL
jgi:pectate lyase